MRGSLKGGTSLALLLWIALASQAHAARTIAFDSVGHPEQSQISADGRSVVYRAPPVDGSPLLVAHVWDRQTGTVSVLRVPILYGPIGFWDTLFLTSKICGMTPSGRVIACRPQQYVYEDRDFLYDCTTQRTQAIPSADGPGDYPPPLDRRKGARWSPDLRWVAWTRRHSATNGMYAIFMWNVETGDVERVGLADGGGEANGHCGGVSLSYDGQIIAFHSSATNLTPEDGNGDGPDVFVHDRRTKETELVSIGPDGRQIEAVGAHDTAISWDGRYVTFSLQERLPVRHDTGAVGSYIRDRVAHTTEPVRPDKAGGYTFFGRAGTCALSADGRVAVFGASSKDAAAGAKAEVRYFARNFRTGETVLACLPPDGEEAPDRPFESYRPLALAADGSCLLFSIWVETLGVHAPAHYRSLYLREFDWGGSLPEIEERPPEPIATDGPSGDVPTTTPVFRWKPVWWADHYVVYISESPDLSDPRSGGITTEVTRLYGAAPGLSNEVKHYWAVAAIDADGNEIARSEVQSFTPTLEDAEAYEHIGQYSPRLFIDNECRFLPTHVYSDWQMYGAKLSDDPGCLLDLSDQMEHYRDTYPITSYVHVVTDSDDRGKFYVFQYWFYYVYNDYPTPDAVGWDHDSDWEHIEVYVPVDGLGEDPAFVRFFHHHTPYYERAWEDVRHDGQRVDVAIVNDGHGSYAVHPRFNVWIPDAAVKPGVEPELLPVDGKPYDILQHVVMVAPDDGAEAREAYGRKYRRWHFYGGPLPSGAFDTDSEGNPYFEFYADKYPYADGKPPMDAPWIRGDDWERPLQVERGGLLDLF